MNIQTTNHLLMIRPCQFDYNEETAVNNAFQAPTSDSDIQSRALDEFNRMADLLESNDIDLLVVDDSPVPPTPDAIFPNNWVSFHSNGTAILYPMFAPSRRRERKSGVLERVREVFKIRHILNLSDYEKQDMFLEGTGSMVLDRVNHVAYACLSRRTNRKVLDEFCRKMSYKPVVFEASDHFGQPIYHTNVMMSVGDKFAVICLDSRRKEQERERVRKELTKVQKEIIEIDERQMAGFAGNILQVRNRKGDRFIIMSSSAHAAFRPEQLAALSRHGKILHSDIPTIEINGGGSARCMIAEIFLPGY
ncbi:MAG: citrulline utilization hydrolase CtlX [bacterium]